MWAELLHAWVEDDHEDEFAWDLISCLNRRGELKVVHWSLALLQNERGALRELAAVLLRHHGCERGRPFARTVVGQVAAVLATETDPAARQAMVAVIASSELPSELDRVRPWANDADPDIRETVAVNLPSLWPNSKLPDRVIETLVMLSRDGVARIRDWAGYSLGSGCDNDTPVVRATLIDRLGESFDESDAAAEAAIGLARRGDPQAFGHIERWLTQEEPNWRILDAAGKCGRIELLPMLEDLRGEVRDEEELFLSIAIERVTDRAAWDWRTDRS